MKNLLRKSNRDIWKQEKEAATKEKYRLQEKKIKDQIAKKKDRISFELIKEAYQFTHKDPRNYGYPHCNRCSVKKWCAICTARKLNDTLEELNKNGGEKITMNDICDCEQHQADHTKCNTKCNCDGND